MANRGQPPGLSTSLQLVGIVVGAATAGIAAGAALVYFTRASARNADVTASTKRSSGFISRTGSLGNAVPLFDSVQVGMQHRCAADVCKHSAP